MADCGAPLKHVKGYSLSTPICPPLKTHCQRELVVYACGAMAEPFSINTRTVLVKGMIGIHTHRCKKQFKNGLFSMNHASVGLIVV